jgi:plasmid stability protein
MRKIPFKILRQIILKMTEASLRRGPKSVITPFITLFRPFGANSIQLDIIEIVDYDEITQTGVSVPMSSITIRNLDPAIKERLRVRAAEHGHSMEAEARRILQTTLKGPVRPPASNLYERIRARVDPIGGIDLELPPREPTREPPRFE